MHPHDRPGSGKSNIQPLPYDPSKHAVQEFLDMTKDTDWLLTATGEYSTGAVRVYSRAHDEWSTRVALQWPTRRNHTDEEGLLRLLIDPEDIPGLIDVLEHTKSWYDAARLIGN